MNNKLNITAKDLWDTKDYWCDKCAIGHAYHRQFGEWPYGVSERSMYGRNYVRIEFPRYTEEMFNRDVKASEGAPANKIIRTITFDICGINA